MKEYSLNYLRGLASLLVVYAHLVVVASEAEHAPSQVFGFPFEGPLAPELFEFRWLNKFLYYDFGTTCGELGVFIFFLISGYFVPAIIDKYGQKSYIFNRVLRIYPTHLLCLILAIVTLNLFANVYDVEVLPSVRSFLGNALLLHGFIGEGPIIGVLWSLQVEIIFYLVILVISMIVKEFRAWHFLLAMLMFCLPQYFREEIFTFLPTEFVNALIYTVHFVSCILIGTIIFYTRKYSATLALLYISSAVLIFYLNSQAFKEIGLVKDVKHFQTLLLALFVFICFQANVLKLSDKHKVLSFFSDISYPMYLIHLPLGFVSIALLSKLNIVGLLSLFLAVILVVVLSFIIHKTVELPSHNLGKMLSIKFQKKEI